VTFVLDASVAVGWCLPDERNDYTNRILRRIADEPAIVSAVWALEVANGLLVAERRGRLSAAEIPRLHTLLSTLPIQAYEAALDPALGPVLAVARTHTLSAYDASHLELAMREGLALATIDQNLRAAALAAGVALPE
jgi:predicted nucleic acid-binding protein